MMVLTNTDLHFIVSRIPKDVRELLHQNRLFLSGGFICSTIAGERVSDIDLFGPDADDLERHAIHLALKRKGRVHTTDNAHTILSPPRKPVQFISRWVFDEPHKLIKSFDFTICQAAVWFEGEHWLSICSDGFYPDLAARRLTYTSPERNEDAGGSLLRVRKFLAAGYNIQAPSLGRVLARLVSRVDFARLSARGEISEEEWWGNIIIGLLREVDPLVVVDGVDMVDEHQLGEGEIGEAAE